MAKPQRYYLDCRTMPSKKKCTLRMTGKAKELLDAGVEHAIKAHGHRRSVKLRAEIKKMMKKSR